MDTYARRTGNDLRSVDFNETEVTQRVAEQLADARLDAKYCLIGHRAKVKDAVVQSRVHVHLCQFLQTKRQLHVTLLI